MGIFVLLLAILGGLGYWLYTSLSGSSTGELVDVPRVVNLSFDEARSAIEGAGFAVARKDEPNDVTPAGTVFDQSPKGGEQYEKGKTVSLSVSSGPAQIEIPNVAGRSRADALKLLDDRGFNNVQPVDQASDSVPKDQVIGTDPAAGQKAAANAAIRLLISSGQDSVAIPNVVGKSVDSARQALTAAGFKVGTVIQRASDTVPKDQAIGTDPDGAAPKGSTVNIIQSTGSGKVRVPSVLGQPETAATQTIQNAGLEVEVRTRSVPAGDPNVGRVVAVNPAVGTQVDPNSTVQITVGVASGSTTTTSSATTTTTTGP